MTCFDYNNVLLLQILKGGAGAEEKDNLKQISNEVREYYISSADQCSSMQFNFMAKVTHKILVLYKGVEIIELSCKKSSVQKRASSHLGNAQSLEWFLSVKSFLSYPRIQKMSL